MRRAVVVSVLGLASVSCSEPTSSAPRVGRAELGVFYGGQVQQLRSVPWPSGARQPTWGFRLVFREPLAQELAVRWEVDMPSRTARGQRIERVSEVSVGAGRVRLDQAIDVPAAAELGLWNVRVIAAERLVLDRAVRLFDPGSEP